MSNDKQSIKFDKEVVMIDAEAYTSIHYSLDDLTKLLEDVISDLYNVKGGQQLRHSYMLYRDRVNEIREKLKKEK